MLGPNEFAIPDYLHSRYRYVWLQAPERADSRKEAIGDGLNSVTLAPCDPGQSNQRFAPSDEDRLFASACGR